MKMWKHTVKQNHPRFFFNRIVIVLSGSDYADT